MLGSGRGLPRDIDTIKTGVCKVRKVRGLQQWDNLSTFHISNSTQEWDKAE